MGTQDLAHVGSWRRKRRDRVLQSRVWCGTPVAIGRRRRRTFIWRRQLLLGGNPYPDTDGSGRGGDNLYTNCILALDVETGKLRWYFQFTPHDVHDWDSTEPPVLVDARFHGRERKLLLHADRNVFFYVLDRTNGEFLLAAPFVRRLTWASGIGKEGRPQLLPSNEPTPQGTKTCPDVRGATNWYSPAFSPATGLFYVMAVENCSIYRQARNGGFIRFTDPLDQGMKYLRALDIQTGRTVWEIPQIAPTETNYSGVLSTAGGLVFYGETGGGFAAVDAQDWAHPLAFRKQRDMESLTHDLHGQRAAIPSHCVRREYSLFRAAGELRGRKSTSGDAAL
jgi:outer membrane protein assembly factor BamB